MVKDFVLPLLRIALPVKYCSGCQSWMDLERLVLASSLDESQIAAGCFLNYLSGLVHFCTCRSARSYTFLVPEFAVASQAVFKFGDGVMVDSSLRPHGCSSSIVPHSTLDFDARSPQRRPRTSMR
jgi:hypothetical protein